MDWVNEWSNTSKAARKAHPAPITPEYTIPYFKALTTLSGDRLNKQNGMLGPIPFTAIERYADRFVSRVNFECFVDTLMEIDGDLVETTNLKAQKRMVEQNGRHKNN